MNRNVESHFATTPQVNHQRSSFDRSFSHKLTFNFGDLIPLYWDDVLPGDTVSMDTSKIIRLQTMLAPIYDNMYFDTYWFFVPLRILWDNTKKFFGESKTAWTVQPEAIPNFPRLGAPDGGFQSGSLADYMGLPLGVAWSRDDINAPIRTPFSAYVQIWNDFFRDINVMDAEPLDTTDGNLSPNKAVEAQRGNKILRASRYHDYFSSCLPSPQRGPSVSLFGSGTVPVVSGPNHGIYGSTVDESGQYMYGTNTIVQHTTRDITTGTELTAYKREGSSDFSNVNNTDWRYTSGRAFAAEPIAFTNYWADFSNPASNLGFSINELRLATLTQMYYERLSLSGNTYEEMIQGFFGVSNPDSRVQKSEYLGGNRVQINVREITNTAQSEQDFLGDLGAQSVTADSHSDFTASFTEYGYLMCVGVARYDHSYSQGLAQKWLRNDKFKYYNPMFARIGEQPVYDCELYATRENMTSLSVFGYQEAWASYRYAPNTAAGLLRPNVEGAFNHWTLGDSYNSMPTLSEGWMYEDKDNVDRALAVKSTQSDQLFADFYFNAKWVRPMPMYSVPGAIGQF